ncbi:F-box domain-containing protein [Mycena kentingensis (nom. inval.)]|nr:F-box domain-containing protein [Mycena kentingensis (nom. inval.)]
MTDTTALAKQLISEHKRPTAEQDATLREAIPRLQSTVRRLDSQFTDVDIALTIGSESTETQKLLLQATLSKLDKELSAAQEVLAVHMRAVTFARQIPVEVLEVIFLHTLPEGEARPLRREAPLLLCQICSAWRAVALATPRLWAALSLSVDRRPGEWRDLIETWLGRSADCPLDISFVTGRNGDPNGGRTMMQFPYFNEHVVRMVRPYSRRWQRLQLDVSALSATRLLNASLPRLETLELNTRGEMSSLYISFADAPKLRRVFLVGDRTAVGKIHLPWPHLTELHIPDCPTPVDDIYRILARATVLVSCSIHLSSIHGQSNNTPAPLLPIILPVLDHLSLAGFLGETTAKSFLTNLVAPKIDTLELIAEGKYGAEWFPFGDAAPLAVFARKNGLRSLTLRGGDAERGLFETVVAIPSLREVTLSFGGTRSVPKDVRQALEMREQTRE